ncbi:hypothetical protein V8E36_007602 [Tilletia maclaganii]
MAGKRGGRGGSAGAKRPAVEAEQSISSLKVRIKRSKASKDSEDSKEALLDAELDNAEEHEGDAANVLAKNPTYWLKILCFMPGDPKAKSVVARKIQQLKGDIMINIEAGDSLNDLIPKLADKVVKRIGGCPAVWDIALQAEGSHAGMFKEPTTLELGYDGANEEAEEVWGLFLEAVVECGNSKVHVTSHTNMRGEAVAPASSASTSSSTKNKKTGAQDEGGVLVKNPNEIVASAAGKTVTAGHMDKDRQLTSKYICEAPACPNKKDGIQYCWHPFWAPQQHLPMSNQVRSIWIRAWESVQPSVDISRPPRVAPFIQPAKKEDRRAAVVNRARGGGGTRGKAAGAATASKGA